MKLTTYHPIRERAPVARVVNRGIRQALPGAAVWCLACASCFALGYVLALAWRAGGL